MLAVVWLVVGMFLSYKSHGADPMAHRPKSETNQRLMIVARGRRRRHCRRRPHHSPHLPCVRSSSARASAKTIYYLR